MIPENVTLIVKAPNQQIEDQNVECQSSWTVRQLKGHLSEVYPSKPRTEEQKIIYSGQLLDDNIILKDVLRTYETQFTHTMHLVCTPNRHVPEPVTKPAPAEPTVDTTDGLRRRNVEVQETPRPEMRQNDQNHTVEMQNYISSVMNNYGRVPPYPNYNMGEGYLPVANDPTSMANHMMMMQQAYIQYMQQYANMWQNPPPAAPVAEAPRAEPPAEEAEEGRDWLEHLYAASRLAILSSLVYLYGSGPRLLLVVLLAVAGYLHQIGFFRDLNLNLRNENQQANGQAANNGQQRANNGQQQPNNGQQLPNNGQQPANNGQPQANADQPGNAEQPANNAQQGDSNGPQANAPEPEPQNNQQSLLAVTWMIFTTFFTSLIPEAQH